MTVVELIKFNSTPKCSTLTAAFFKDSINLDVTLMFPNFSSFPNIHCNLISGTTEYIRLHMLVFTGMNTCVCVWKATIRFLLNSWDIICSIHLSVYVTTDIKGCGDTELAHQAKFSLPTVSMFSIHPLRIYDLHVLLNTNRNFMLTHWNTDDWGGQQQQFLSRLISCNCIEEGFAHEHKFLRLQTEVFWWECPI